jgi:hypothetical protein
MQLKAKGPEPRGDGGPQRPGLLLGVAVRNNVVRLCRAPGYAEREMNLLVRTLVPVAGAA